MIKITNLNQIEEKVGKKTAEAVLKATVDYIRNCLSPEYIMVKYEEDIMAIVFSGGDEEGVYKFLVALKSSVEKIKVKIVGSVNENYNGQTIVPRTNMVYTTYYKETALENVINNLREYYDECQISESDVTGL